MKHLVHNSLDPRHPLIVSDRGQYRCLQFGPNSCEQSRIDLKNPHHLQIAYTRTMMCGLLFQQQPKRILLMGLGGGSMVHFLLHHLKEVQLDVIEQSDGVIRVAQDFFNVSNNEQLRLINTRAEDFLTERQSAAEPQYDLIFVDLFGPNCMAPALFNEDFHNLLLTCLGSNGLAIYNLWSGNKDAFDAVCSTIDLTFNSRVLRLPVFEDPNICLLAFADKPPQKAVKEPNRINRLTKRFNLNFKQMSRQLIENNNDWAKQTQ